MGGFNNGDLSYYNIGTNFMLVAIALGGFYLIPSIQSFFWNIVTIPIAYVMVVGLGTITYSVGLPVFSLPFCIVVILFLYCLQLRKNPKKLVATPIQYYSPEINLYNFLNGKERLLNKFYLPFSLPVMGKWMISQGHNGNMTHQGDWSNAIDLVILDDEMKTFQLPGNKPEHFYCYNKPVISPADGIVEEIIDYVPDNEIGNNNTNQNWGNSIIIKHAIGLYSKISHLKLNSIKVSTGSFVKKGDVIAMCGNSGRSPEPHLHFQIQSTPYIGSKTINYPIAYFYSTIANTTEINNYAIPKEGSFVSNITPNVQLQHAFNFQPGLTIDVSTDNQTSQKWEIGTDMYNESFIYCKEENAYAYFISNGTVFYFTNYIGPKESLLYYFYLSAYKVLLSSENKVLVKDTYPLNTFRFNLLRWIQDIVAPIFIFIKIKYESESVKEDGFLSSGKLSLSSKRIEQIGWNKKIISKSIIIIENNSIQSFCIELKHKTINALCNLTN
jgi:murein DD-endopeptidase MepM/ murein hydrolase activator NlpD